MFPLPFCFSVAVEAAGSQVSCTDPVKLWEAVLQTFGTSVYAPYVYKLLLIQWMLWLMHRQLERILALLTQTNHKVLFYHLYKNSFKTPLGSLQTLLTSFTISKISLHIY